MNNDGERTLRSYSRPVNLAAVFGPKWATIRGDVFHVAEFMVSVATRRCARCSGAKLVSVLYVTAAVVPRVASEVGSSLAPTLPGEDLLLDTLVEVDHQSLRCSQCG